MLELPKGGTRAPYLNQMIGSGMFKSTHLCSSEYAGALLDTEHQCPKVSRLPWSSLRPSSKLGSPSPHGQHSTDQ